MDLPKNSTHDTELFETPTASSYGTQRAGELDIATVTAIHSDGTVEIQCLEQHNTLCGISTVALQPSDIGRQVAYMTTTQPQQQVIIIGLIRSSIDRLFDIIDVKTTNHNNTQDSNTQHNNTKDSNINPPPSNENTLIENSEDNIGDNPANPGSSNTVCIDGQRVNITGQEEIILQCGEASITLRKDGKIVIRGKSLLNRASGVNRIMGASVQVN